MDGVVYAPVDNLCDLSQLTTRWRGGSESLTEYIWVEIIV